METAIRLVHLATHVTAEGKDQRSKLQNLGKPLERLREKLERRAYKPKPRKKTQPSKSAVRRRLEGKKHASKKKQARRTDAD